MRDSMPDPFERKIHDASRTFNAESPMTKKLTHDYTEEVKKHVARGQKALRKSQNVVESQRKGDQTRIELMKFGNYASTADRKYV